MVPAGLVRPHNAEAQGTIKNPLIVNLGEPRGNDMLIFLRSRWSSQRRDEGGGGFLPVTAVAPRRASTRWGTHTIKARTHRRKEGWGKRRIGDGQKLRAVQNKEVSLAENTECDAGVTPLNLVTLEPEWRRSRQATGAGGRKSAVRTGQMA